jgi:hypothetical protein
MALRAASSPSVTAGQLGTRRGQQRSSCRRPLLQAPLRCRWGSTRDWRHLYTASVGNTMSFLHQSMHTQYSNANASSKHVTVVDAVPATTYHPVEIANVDPQYNAALPPTCRTRSRPDWRQQARCHLCRAPHHNTTATATLLMSAGHD